ncbi:hypothetical protein [Bradyrhizobium sp. USDA 3315]
MSVYQMALAELPVKRALRLAKSARRRARSTRWSFRIIDRQTGRRSLKNTRDARRRIIEKFRLKHGAKRVRMLGEPHLIKIMDEITSLSSRRS